MCTRVSTESENIHRISPTGSSVSQNILKSEPASCRTSYTNSSKNDMNSSPTLELKNNFNVPIFVLHAKGSFYVPLTIDYNTLYPYLNSYDLLEVSTNTQNIVLHPVTINVNFQSNLKQPKRDYPNKWN